MLFLNANVIIARLNRCGFYDYTLIMVPQENPDKALPVENVDRASDALRDFYQRSHRLMDRIMTAKGASFSRARTLKEIGRTGSLRSIDLAASFGYAPRTVTEAIDGLERDGLVRRTPDPDDRRAKRISLTPAGRAAVAAAEGSREKYMQDVFGILSTNECNEIVRIVGKLNMRLAALEG